jgi:transcription initiation factor IIE alpha subunit
MIAKQAVNAKALKWTILKLGDVGKLPDPSKIIEALARHGVSMQQPAFLKDIHSIISQGEAFDQGLQKEFGLFKNEDIRLVLVILPSNKAATYARVKHWGDYKNGTFMFVYADHDTWVIDGLA